MLGEWVEQSTTTTGTGNLTLAAVTGLQTLHGEFGTAQSFFYVITDANDKPLEGGIGRMSDSTTMVREQVVKKYDGAFSYPTPNSGSGQLSLAAGTKKVRATPLAASLVSNPHRSFASQNATANNRIVVPSNVYGVSTGTNSLTAGRLYAYPAYFRWAGNYDAFAVRASAGANVDIGLYRLQPDGLPGALVVGVQNVAVVGGMNYLTFTAQAIRPGWYILAVNQSSTISLYSYILEEGYGRTDLATQVPALFKTHTQGTLPDPFGGTLTIGNLALVPGIALRHV